MRQIYPEAATSRNRTCLCFPAKRSPGYTTATVAGSKILPAKGVVELTTTRFVRSSDWRLVLFRRGFSGTKDARRLNVVVITRRQSLRSVFGSTSCFGCAAGFSFFNTTDAGLNDTTTRDLTMCTSYSRPLDERVPYLAGVRPSSCGGADGLEDRHEYVRVVIRHLALKLSKPGTEKNKGCGRNANDSP